MNSLNLKQIDGGNIIKQADSGSMFKFELLDENHKKFEEQLGDTATVILKQGTVAVFKKIVAVTDNCVAFNLDKILEVGDYILEIIVGSYVFPSNNRLKISVESTYGDYQPENLVRITYEEIDEKINALTDRLEEFNVAGQTEMMNRIVALEKKEDKDTVYDDTKIKNSIDSLKSTVEQNEVNVNQELLGIGQKQAKMNDRLSVLESKEDKDTIYDDSEINRRVSALEERPTVEPYDDSEVKNRLTALEEKEDHDTIYDDTEIKQSIANVDNKMSGLSEKVTALEERPIVDTALTERVEALERKEDKDTVYDDTDIKERIETLEAKPDNDTIYDDTGITERIEKIEASVTRRAPTGYTLDRTTTPWTIWFDNGCGMTIPDYSARNEDSAGENTIYGFGYSANIMTTTVISYPIPQNFIAASMGHISLLKFSKQNTDSFMHMTQGIEIINPIKTDSSKYDWSKCYGENAGANDWRTERKTTFPRVCYELGIWSDSDVKYLGAKLK